MYDHVLLNKKKEKEMKKNEDAMVNKQKKKGKGEKGRREQGNKEKNKL